MYLYGGFHILIDESKEDDVKFLVKIFFLILYLGLLLFDIYMSDMPNCKLYCDIHSFTEELFQNEYK